MESESPTPARDDAHAHLSAAGAAPRRLTAGLRLPPGMYPLLGAGVALQIGAAAYGIAQQTAAGLAVLLAGLAVLLLITAATLHRFRQINGVAIDGLASQLVLGAGVTASSVYLGALAAATWAAFSSAWWAVALAAAVGGTGYALATRRWWHAYRQDPVAHASGASPRMLAALGVLACLGLAALVVVR